jgi:phosphate transport system substrate-binding protein
MSSHRILRLAALSVAVGLGAIAARAQAVPVDPQLPDYVATPGVSGSLKSIGSDTMNNEMTLWAEGFRQFYPNVKIEIEGKGSSTAPAALIAGTAQFGPMSRAMKQQEIDEFEKKFGYKPVPLETSIDVLAIYVHKDNPLKGLTLPQADALFSKGRKGGFPNDIRTWGDAGLTGEWASLPVSLYGRNSASGTYGFFKEHALANGDYKDQVKEQPGSSSVVQGVASDKAGAGYSGIGYKTADVRAAPLARKAGEAFVEPSMESAYSGEYPLARFLYLYVNYKPGTELDPLRREFVKFIFSKQGQSAVVKDGYFPVKKVIADRALKAVGVAAPAAPPEKKSDSKN